VRRFDHGRFAAHARTYDASQGSDPGQILRTSLRATAGPGAYSSHGHSPPRRRSPLEWGASPWQYTPPQRHTSDQQVASDFSLGGQSCPVVCAEATDRTGLIFAGSQRRRNAYDGRMEPPNSSSQCFQKGQCF